MKFHPNTIIYTVFKRYMKSKYKEEFDLAISKVSNFKTKHYLNAMLKNFDADIF